MSDPPPTPARLGGPLDDVNDAFHAAYDADRAEAEREPILVVLADDLVLFRGREQTRFHVTTDELTAVKSVAHAPVALWLLLQRPEGAERARGLAALRAHITASLPSSLLSDTLRWMDRMPLDLDELAAAFGPRLMESIAHATRLQLDALHAATERALATLSLDERRSLHVAVTGDHQARVRSLPMQYFQKRFGDPDRVLYAEGVDEAEGAAALVGKQRLDRAMAKAFFGDPRRMQRDLLGDAAKTELARTELARIDE